MATSNKKKGLFMYTDGSKQDPSLSQESAENLARAGRIKASLATLSRALEDLATLESEITMLLEAGRESCTLVRESISNLQSDANSPDMSWGKLPQFGSSMLGQVQAQDQFALGQAPQTAGAATQQFVPTPWPQDRG